MPSEFTARRRVAFAETDMAGIVHFSNYFRYMEETEHAFFRSLGSSIHAEVDGQTISWPRVQVSCDFKAPLRFEDEVEIRLVVKEKRARSLVFGFEFHRADPSGSTLVATGELTTVCVSINESGHMQAVPIPERLSRSIEVVDSEHPAPASA